MADKDLLVIIAEMLRKQDQHTEMLSSQSSILSRQTEILEKHSEIMTDTNKTLKQFVAISINQFDEQQKFNEHMLSKVDGLEKTVSKAINLENRVNRLENAVFKSNN